MLEPKVTWWSPLPAVFLRHKQGAGQAVLTGVVLATQVADHHETAAAAPASAALDFPSSTVHSVSRCRISCGSSGRTWRSLHHAGLHPTVWLYIVAAVGVEVSAACAGTDQGAACMRVAAAWCHATAAACARGSRGCAVYTCAAQPLHAWPAVMQQLCLLGEALTCLASPKLVQA